MSEYIVLAHAGEEALPVVLPIVLVVLFMMIKSRRDSEKDRNAPSEHEDE